MCKKLVLLVFILALSLAACGPTEGTEVSVTNTDGCQYPSGRNASRIEAPLGQTCDQIVSGNGSIEYESDSVRSFTYSRVVFSTVTILNPGYDWVPEDNPLHNPHLVTYTNVTYWIKNSDIVEEAGE